MKGISMIVGQKGSGKSTILEIINSFGLYTSELPIHIKYLEFEDKKRTDLEGNGWTDSAISLACENGLREVSGQIFLTGISRPMEIDYLNKQGIKYEIICVSSDESLMYKRILERNRRGEENMSFERFKEMCANRIGKIKGFESNDLDGLIELTNYHILNNGTLEELYYNTKKMLQEKGHIK